MSSPRQTYALAPLTLGEMQALVEAIRRAEEGGWQPPLAKRHAAALEKVRAKMLASAERPAGVRR